MNKRTATVRANGLYNPFTGTKKWMITCSECDHTWKEKVPVVENCSAICPNCKTQNVWSFSKFMKNYNDDINRHSL